MNNKLFFLLLLCSFLMNRKCRALTSLPLEREVFSVAPMMGHTNRHHHEFFRHSSKRAHLYTEMIPASQIVSLYESDKLGLDEQLRINDNSQPVILQLGGSDPDDLGRAATIGAEFGYNGINLNCGCPSNAVSRRCGGASLMRDPSHVARIVENMSVALEPYPDGELSVKYRLGVAEASEYSVDHDNEQNDSEAYRTSIDFVRSITMNSKVKKLHVHGRLALLGDFQPGDNEKASPTSLWIPGEERNDGAAKIDHKRAQYQAKRLARLSTIMNRSVPPLRERVVNELASTMPHLEFVTNGGIHSMDDIQKQMENSPPNMVGALIGRAVINHPYAFASVDSPWGEHAAATSETVTRGQVLKAFAEYCGAEEDRQLSLGRPAGFIETLRRRLVAVPFTLFMGEAGNNAFQRRVRKLISRAQRHSARSILLAAMREVPLETLERSVLEYSLEIEDYSAYNQRCGPLQRAIL